MIDHYFYFFTNINLSNEPYIVMFDRRSKANKNEWEIYIIYDIFEIRISCFDLSAISSAILFSLVEPESSLGSI